MRFSFVIPAHNEQKDLENTLLACLNQNWIGSYEIIVVDDASTDQTLNIALGYASAYSDKVSIRVIRQTRNLERCQSRNNGISTALGEIVIVLNADVMVPPDFLSRINQHYNEGADFVVVGSRIINLDNPYSQVAQSEYESVYHNQQWIEWSEGWSCRKSAILKVGGFPITPVPLTAGEDGWIGSKLEDAGFKKVVDHSIVVTHRWPGTLQEYWRQQVSRGCGTPIAFRYLWHHPMWMVVSRVLLRTVVLPLYLVQNCLFFFFVGIIAMLHLRWRWKHAAEFLWVDTLTSVARWIGQWKGVRKLLST